MTQARILALLGLLVPHLAGADPISVAGFEFAGEVAFADDAFLVSGVITGGTPEQIRDMLIGSDISDSFNTGDSGGGIVEVVFHDNSVINGPGPDIVLFELSGDQPAGTLEPREIFDVSVFDGLAFTPFVTVTPVATGFDDPADSSLDVFAVLIDLSDFGLPPGAAIHRIRLGIYNADLGSKSADLTAVGALQSGGAIPEPSTALLLAGGLLGLGLVPRRMRLDRASRSTWLC